MATLQTLNLLAVIVEFLGTFIFLTVIVVTGNPWAIGATLAAVIYLGGPISGGDFNPAVTVMNLYRRAIGPETAGAYIVAQVLAGLTAATVYAQMRKGGIL